MTVKRPVISVEALLAIAVLYLLLAFNGPFWRAALAGRSLAQPASWGFALALAAIGAGLYFLVLGLVSLRWTVRPLLALLFVVSAAASWYMERYGVFVDRAMVRNVLATHPAEARELLVAPMFLRVLVLGVLPAALLWWPRLRRRRWLPAAGIRAASLIASLLLVSGSALAVFPDFASLMRNRGEVRHLVTPGNIVASVAREAWSDRGTQGPKQVVGADATLGPAWQARSRPALFVLVVGETARSRNFSLNGYERQTNPELARRDIVNFGAAKACGTSTEVSLPCMFSPFGRRDYDDARIRSHESLLHVLARSGLKVVWRDNQSGCKGVCEGLPVQQLSNAKVEGLCPEGQCLDEVLLHGLDSVLADAHGNLFVVMHQLGSHGPSYFRRYPAAFKRFSPACESDDLRRCSPEEIRNAYDNSLLYTDHFLGRLIDFLAARQDRWDAAMLYVSDHGESLGEKGLYLHGVPYAIAPDEQLQVPMLAWFSPGFRQAFQLDTACLGRPARTTPSHDNLFHSLLGLLDVRTSAYDPAMDLFAPCRTKSAATASSAGVTPDRNRP